MDSVGRRREHRPMKGFVRVVLLLVAVTSCGGVPEGSLADGERCTGSTQCRSGYCERKGGNDFSTCEVRCKPAGDGCVRSGQADGSCCSGRCSSNGSCA
ncbi:MAG: hypothetical protein JNK82_39720 [Myxococcaceae bacterium]|nr:hypothetical protein [Myxococcaceae bacterium]